MTFPAPFPKTLSKSTSGPRVEGAALVEFLSRKGEVPARGEEKTHQQKAKQSSKSQGNGPRANPGKPKTQKPKTRAGKKAPEGVREEGFSSLALLLLLLLLFASHPGSTYLRPGPARLAWLVLSPQRCMQALGWPGLDSASSLALQLWFAETTPTINCARASTLPPKPITEFSPLWW